MARGVDYGLGRTNIDLATGIRYGVIPVGTLGDEAIEEFETRYTPRCPECGGEVSDAPDTDAFVCATHGEQEHDTCFGDEPDAITYERDGYAMSLDSQNDVFIVASPYYTRAAFCSPCAPGACYLTSPCDDGERAYCPGPEWFDGPAPYPIFKVSDGSEVKADG